MQTIGHFADYIQLNIATPFRAPVYYIAETASTMNEARKLAAAGSPDGTVIIAGQQTAGRGRLDGRIWTSPADINLLCTIILRRPYTEGFTLRVGLAAAQAVSDFMPSSIPVRIKWPNDILADGKKITGILCETDGTCLYVGIGCNILQTDFPIEIQKKATSIAVHSNSAPTVNEFLAVLLCHFADALTIIDWQTPITQILYRYAETVTFYPGTSTETAVTGTLRGIGIFGELLIESGGTVTPYLSGELLIPQFT